MDKKICSRCGEYKYYSSFSPDKRSCDGLRGTCKSCHRESARRHREKLGQAYEVAQRKNKKRWKKANREKQLAHKCIYRAVHSGKIEKPTMCEKCGSGGDIHGHHNNGYENALDVIWLCPLCHKKEHSAIVA